MYSIHLSINLVTLFPNPYSHTLPHPITRSSAVRTRPERSRLSLPLSSYTYIPDFHSTLFLLYACQKIGAYRASNTTQRGSERETELRERRGRVVVLWARSIKFGREERAAPLCCHASERAAPSVAACGARSVTGRDGLGANDRGFETFGWAEFRSYCDVLIKE